MFSNNKALIASRSSPMIVDRKLNTRKLPLTRFISFGGWMHPLTATNLVVRAGSRRMRAPVVLGAHVALPWWKYPRVAPETIPLRGLPHQEWVSERTSKFSEYLGWTHRAILPGRYPILCPRRHQYGKENTANYWWNMCTRRSIKRQMVVTIRIWKKRFRTACHFELSEAWKICECENWEIKVLAGVECLRMSGLGILCT